MRSRLLVFLLFIITGPFTLVAQQSDSTAQSQPRIWQIEFKGLEKTKASFLHSVIAVQEGEVLDSARLEEDVQMLIRLPSVAHAYFQVFASHDNYYQVYYHIQENFTLLPIFNIWTVGDQLWWMVGLSEYNLLGRNIQASAFYRNNTKHSYGLSLNAPFLLGAQWGTSASYADWVSDEPVYFGEITAMYEYRNRSLELLGLYRWNFNNQVQFGGSIFREQYTYLSGAEQVEDKPVQLLQNKWLAKLTYQYYKVKQHYQYLDGIVNNLSLQTVITTNEQQPPFNIAWNDFIVYRRTGERGNLAWRFRLGFSTNNNSPFSAFVVDNQMNIRGVGDRIDRGSAVVTLNSEYRHTFWEKPWAAIQGVGFVDYGSWRQPGGELDDFVEAPNVYVHSGVGARFILKKVYNATLRVDYGFGLTPENNAHGLVLGLGQYF
ncbi:MAG: POTRA domain-containing protein [Owenweeksia sp.]